MALEQEIANLRDQQALSIVSSITGEFASDDTPTDASEQRDALQALLSESGNEVDIADDQTPSEEDAAEAARALLALMASNDEMRPVVQQWLDDPPTQEAAAIPLLLAAPVVFAGCLVLLQVAGHTRIKRSSTGKWQFDYDPSRKTPFDETTKNFSSALSQLLGKLTGGAT